ncbi:MAG: sel1 repeat family protein [Candidatus Adiutrix sp.]|jgi:TPR repeat protein|nr:sel1 repeat family protein [Candidatus Adiutrix sp.]
MHSYFRFFVFFGLRFICPLILAAFLALSPGRVAAQGDEGRVASVWLQEIKSAMGDPAVSAWLREVMPRSTTLAEDDSNPFWKMYGRGNILAGVWLELINMNNAGEMEKWAARNKENQVVAVLKQASEKTSEADLMLALIYRGGFAEESRNEEESHKWILKAAEAGNAEAQMVMYQLAGALTDDSESALAWLRRAADGGSDQAQMMLGLHYYLESQSKGVAAAMEEKRLRETEAAGEGAATRTGSSQAEAKAAPPQTPEQLRLEAAEDLKNALRCFELAAGQGNPVALQRLVEMYESGDGVGRDYVESAKWLKMWADRGHVPSQLKLALGYSHGGPGSEKKTAETLAQYQKEAEAGRAEAQFFLGALRSGLFPGYALDREQSLTWLEKAFAGGDKRAALLLGQIYLPVYITSAMTHKFEDFPKDLEKAEMWLNRAAEAGLDDAWPSLSNIRALPK